MPNNIEYKKIQEQLKNGYKRLLEVSTVDVAANEQVFLQFKNKGANMFKEIYKMIAEVELENGDALVAQLKSDGMKDEDVARHVAILKLLGKDPDIKAIAKMAGNPIEDGKADMEAKDEEIKALKKSLADLKPEEKEEDAMKDLPEKAQEILKANQAKIKELEDAREADKKEVADMKDEAFTKEMKSLIQSDMIGVGKVDDLLKILKGASDETRPELVNMFTAQAKALKDSGIFTEAGTSDSNDDDIADQWENKTKAYAKENKLSMAEAYDAFGKTAEGKEVRKEMAGLK